MAFVLPYTDHTPISVGATRREDTVHQHIRAMLCVPVTALYQIRPYKKVDGIFAAAPVMLLQLGIHYRRPHQKVSKRGYINPLGLGKKNTASELAHLKGQAGLTDTCQGRVLWGLLKLYTCIT